MKRALMLALVLIVFVSLLGLLSLQPSPVASAPQDTWVYEEDFSTYTSKDFTEKSVWDIWAESLRVTRIDGVDQEDPAVAALGNGDSIVVWVDSRNGTTDIYAQRIDANGNQLWPVDVRVNSDFGEARQSDPAVVVDEGGNSVIVWQDARNNDGVNMDNDIYIQKIDANGNRVWVADKVVHAVNGGSQQDPDIAIDPEGNFVVVWEDWVWRGAPYAQKLDPEGNRIWADDVSVTASSESVVRWTPGVAFGGDGEILVAWADFRNGNPDIYAQRLDASGSRLWSSDARVSSYPSGLAYQTSPDIAADQAGNAFIVWRDRRNDQGDVFIQKLDTNGIPLWVNDSRVNSDSIGEGQGSPVVVLSSIGCPTVAWTDHRDGVSSVYGQRLDADGSKLWLMDVRLNQGNDMATHPVLAQGAGGDIVAAWMDYRGRNYDIYTQGIDADGSRLWRRDARVSADSGMAEQRSPVLAAGSGGNVFVVWSDNRDAEQSIYAQKLDVSGNRLWGTGIYVSSDVNPSGQDHPSAAIDGEGNLFIAWLDYRSGKQEAYLQKLDSDGNRLWNGDVRVNSDSAWVSELPSLAIDHTGNVVVVWRDFRNTDSDIYAQRFDSNGNPLWFSELRVNSDIGDASQEDPNVAFDSNGNAIIVWEDQRNGHSDIYAQSLDTDGNKLWVEDIRVNSGLDTDDHYSAAVATDSDGNSVVVWNEECTEEYDFEYDIYAQKLSADGNRLWLDDVLVNSDSGYSTETQSSPDVEVDASGNISAVWVEYHDLESDIFIQSLGPNGDLMWPEDVEVNSDSEMIQQLEPAIVLDSNGNAVVTWEDSRNGCEDIYVQRINQVGNQIWFTDLRVVYPNQFYFALGAAQSHEIDITDSPITQAMLTANSVNNGGNIAFHLTNNGGEHWSQVTPGVTHVFTTTGSDLRWRVELASDAVWRNRTPLVHSLRIDYSTDLAGGDDYEPDDVCVQAQPLQVNGVAQHHTFHQYEDVDWARFDVVSGTTYIIQIGNTGPNADAELAIFDTCGAAPIEEAANEFGPGVTFPFEASYSGPLYVRVTNVDGATFGEGIDYDLSVQAEAPVGAVIIVAGRRDATDSLQPLITATGNLAYETFLAGGYTADDIQYLNADLAQPGVDGAPTWENVREAVQTWARTRVGLGVPLWIYLVDHGQVDRFHNDVGEMVAAAELDLWLDNLEQHTKVDQVTVIFDACYSGSFIDLYESEGYGLETLSRDDRERVIVSSTSSNWSAYGPPVDGEYEPYLFFSNGFLHALGPGGGYQDVWNAYQRGVEYVESMGQTPGWGDLAYQTPWLDDNGDRRMDGNDGARAQERGLGQLSPMGGVNPYIQSLTVTEVSEAGEATITAQVVDDGGVQDVWARIFAPSFEPPEGGDGTIPVIDVPEVALAGSGIFTGTYSGFTETGAYQVAVYARDGDRNYAQPRWVWVGEARIYLPLVLRGS